MNTKLFAVTFLQAVDPKDGKGPRMTVRAQDVHRLEFNPEGEIVVIQGRNAPGEDVHMIPLHGNVKEMIVNDKKLEAAEQAKLEAEKQAEAIRLENEKQAAAAKAQAEAEAAAAKAEGEARLAAEAAAKAAEDADMAEHIAKAKAELAELDRLTAPDPLPQVEAKPSNPFAGALKKKR